MHQLTRLKATSLVQNACTYLNNVTFFAQTASIGYFFWGWSRKRFHTEEEEADEEAFEQACGSENMVLLISVSDEMNHSKNGIEEIQTLIEEEKKEAVIQEQQEALIIKLTYKRI